MLQAISPLVKSAVACLFVVTLATMPPLSRFYFAELCSHYRVQMAVVGLLFCLLLWCEPQPMLAKYRRLRWRSFAFIPVIIHVMFIVGWYLPGQPLFSAGSGMQPMRLLISNVHTSNTKYEELIALIEREQPDVVTLCEINQNWASALEAVHEQFPYRVVIPRSDNFGIAILSRHYIIRNDVFSLGDAQPPAIEVSIWSDDHRELTIVAAHTYPPVGYQLSNLRNRQLKILGERVSQIGGSRVLVGDFNVSLFSPYYSDLEESSGLRNARKGFGVLPTWPARYRFMRVPIDHCLHSDDVEIRDCRVGPDIGSDHLPLIVELAY